ncbi:UL16-binding protein 1-like isoform X2 [Suricata suricatta]|uniref:UL16-binding protein 1-like isoform X2 n=1 Tax=Suricata suricatta TaxID=37032 RepID=UPI00115594E2|nr:UL16-binding protein 1-like isoform X2 [Suricata suricatta]
MALPAATNFGIGFLALFVMSLGTWGARGGDAPILCYNFSITPRPSLGQPWCDIQGIISGNTFLRYGCGGEKVKLIGPWGTKLNDTEFWERQTETLKDLLEELKKKLLDMKAEDFPHSDSISLQGRMVCKPGDNGRTSASWELHINKQKTYSFNSESKKWTVPHPKDQLVKTTLNSDRDLTSSLMKISDGDCKKWLEQISVHCDEMLGTTALPGPQHVPVPSRATAIRPTTWVLLGILICFIIIVI